MAASSQTTGQVAKTGGDVPATALLYTCVSMQAPSLKGLSSKAAHLVMKHVTFAPSK